MLTQVSVADAAAIRDSQPFGEFWAPLDDLLAWLGGAPPPPLRRAELGLLERTWATALSNRGGEAPVLS